MKRSFLLLCPLLVSHLAFADDLATRAAATPPPPPRPSSFAIPENTLSLSLTFEIESSAEKLGKPVTVAPDITYGATDKLSLALVHSKFAITGFRAVTGGGLCLGGDDACPHPYNNVGAEALYALRTGRLAVAAMGGVHALDFDQGFYDAKLGARVRSVHGKLAVTAMPSVLVAMTKRTDATGATRNKDLYYVPVLGTYRLAKPLTVGLGTGIKGSFQKPGTSWEIPLGVMATYAFSPQVTAGCSFVFGKLIGGADDPPDPMPPATGTDFRGTQIWVVVTP